MAHYLIIRLSAIGDVAMAIPVLYSVAKAHPQHQFTLLTQPFLSNLLINPPSNLEAMGMDIKRDEKTLSGLFTFIQRLKEEHFDVLIDLHDVIRTKLIRNYLKLSGTKVVRIRKPRSAYRRLTARPPHKDKTALKPVIERYADVFRKAGLAIDPPYAILPDLQQSLDSEASLELNSNSSLPKIGIAPFAAHKAKMYSSKLMRELIGKLNERGDVQVLLFGAKGQEKETLEAWAHGLEHVKSVAGTLTLPGELALIRSLKCMLSMDSANMHLASLVGTRVVSIWCATDPVAGFMGYGQSASDAFAAPLDCRPCSIYGQKECYRKDYACREQIDPETILKKIDHILNLTP